MFKIGKKILIPLVVGILIYSFLLRLSYVESYAIAPDIQRHYLVANHILKFKENPKSFQQSIGGNITSPVYYYFLAFWLSLWNNMIILHVVNVILQVVNLFLVYLLARKLFSQSTALITLILLSFSNFNLTQSAFMYNPFAMQPFLTGSYLLMALAFFKKRSGYLILSLVFFAFSGSFHGSVYLVFPVFILTGLAILLSMRAKLSKYVIYFAIWILCLLVTFLPFFNNLRIGFSPSTLSLNRSNIDTEKYLDRFADYFVYLNGTLFNFYDALGQKIALKDIFGRIDNSAVKNLINSHWKLAPNYSLGTSMELDYKNLISVILFVISYLAIFTYLLSSKIPNQGKIFVTIVLAGIFLVIAELSLFDSANFAFWYFSPILNILVIIIVECINRLFSKGLILQGGKLIVLLMFIPIFAFSLNRFSLFHSRSADSNTLLDPIYGSITNYITNNKGDNRLLSLNSFQIKEFRPEGSGFFQPYPYLYNKFELEQGIKLTKLTEQYPNFIETNDDYYLFFVCPSGYDLNCKAVFSSRYSNHGIVSQLYGGYFNAYVAKKR